LALKTEGAAQTVIGQICFGCVWQGLRFILNNVGRSRRWRQWGRRRGRQCRNVQTANSSLH
jgi:hypothetical protein